MTGFAILLRGKLLWNDERKYVQLSDMKYFKIFFCLLSLLLNITVFGQTSLREAVMQGLRFQFQADSIKRLSEVQTVALSSASESEKKSIRLAIREYDAKYIDLQKMAVEKFKLAAQFDEAYIMLPSGNKEPTVMNEKDTSYIEILENKVGNIYNFEILSKSPYSDINPIPIDEPLPDRIVYKIQLGAYGRALPLNNFKGLSPISAEKLENGVTKYYVGLFSLYSDADDALRKVRIYGFNDAYIVAFHNGKPISVERAKQLEINN